MKLGISSERNIATSIKRSFMRADWLVRVCAVDLINFSALCTSSIRNLQINIKSLYYFRRCPLGRSFILEKEKLEN